MSAPLRIYILTIFPGLFNPPLSEGILRRAKEKGLVEVNVQNIRDFSHNKHRTTDDRPYGGGPGMVMKPEPVFEAIDHIKLKLKGKKGTIILMTPQGETFTQEKAKELSKEDHLIFICGHYGGLDERIRGLATDEISIGDYILSGGELAAMVVIDAIVRLIPGVVGDERSIEEDSFYNRLLAHPQYTRPVSYRKMRVPKVLLSGDHEEIKRWRRREALKRTLKRRPDLLKRLDLTNEERKLLKEE